MSKRHLNSYVDQKNWVRRMFKKPELVASNLSAQDVQELLMGIEADLSPENLTCDGELSRSEVAERSAYLKSAQRELLKKFPNIQPSYSW